MYIIIFQLQVNKTFKNFVMTFTELLPKGDGKLSS